jgi:hypothetical protein
MSQSPLPRSTITDVVLVLLIVITMIQSCDLEKHDRRIRHLEAILGVDSRR